MQGVSTGDFPMRMMVDYVRVFKQSNSYNNVNVTFRVDMKNQVVNSTGVWLSGGNLGSGQPGGIQMTQSQGGWEVLDNGCGVGDHNDRSLSISDTDTVLAPICFGDCLTCE